RPDDQRHPDRTHRAHLPVARGGAGTSRSRGPANDGLGRADSLNRAARRPLVAGGSPPGPIPPNAVCPLPGILGLVVAGRRGLYGSTPLPAPVSGQIAPGSSPAFRRNTMTLPIIHRPFDRRTVLKGAAAAGALQVASPFIIAARGETPIRIGMVDPFT